MSKPHAQHLLVTLRAVTVAVFFIGPVLGAQQSPNKSLGDLLIESASEHQAKLRKAQQDEVGRQRQIEELQSRFNRAETESTSLLPTRPTPKNSWKTLEIGEFEQENVFLIRRNQAKASEERESERAENEWRAAVSKHEDEVKALRSKTKAQVAELAPSSPSSGLDRTTAAWRIPESINPSRTTTYKEMPLARFNREAMCFETVIQPAKFDLPSSQSQTLIASLVETTHTRIRITFPTFESAKAFKESFEAGGIQCRVGLGLDLSYVERPIVLQREVVKMEETIATKDNALKGFGALALAAFAQLAGASPEQMQNMGNAGANSGAFEIKPERRRVVVQPEVKVDGTKFHFAVSHETVFFFDNDRKVLAGAEVEFVDECARVTTITPDAQPAAKLLQPGDRILRVGAKAIRDMRGLHSAIRLFKTGQSFDVSYRRGSSDEVLHFRAEGGKPLGIE